jgi:hypothetical protein
MKSQERQTTEVGEYVAEWGGYGLRFLENKRAKYHDDCNS